MKWGSYLVKKSHFKQSSILICIVVLRIFLTDEVAFMRSFTQLLARWILLMTLLYAKETKCKLGRAFGVIIFRFTLLPLNPSLIL